MPRYQLITDTLDKETLEPVSSDVEVYPTHLAAFMRAQYVARYFYSEDVDWQDPDDLDEKSDRMVGRYLGEEYAYEVTIQPAPAADPVAAYFATFAA